MNYNLVAMENFGQWLKRNRKAKGLTQGELGKKAGISASYISTLERQQPHSITGADLRPEPDKIQSLAKALDQDIDEALTLAGYAPQNNSVTVPKPILNALAREGKLSPKDEILIADFIARLKEAQ